MMTLRTTVSALTLTAALLATSAAHGAAIAHWSFDETSGTTVADDVGGNTATVAGTGADLSVAGQFGTGVDLPGTGWYTVPAFGGFQSNSMTFASWVKVDQLEGNNQEVFGKWYSQHHFRFEVRGGTNLRNAADVDIVQGTTNVPDLLWHHVAWVWDRPAGQIRFYLDGVLSVTLNGTANGTISTSGGAFQIGRKDDSATNFNGMLDELWLFNEALTLEQINNLMDYNNIVAPVPAPAALPAGLAMMGLATLRRRSLNRASR